MRWLKYLMIAAFVSCIIIVFYGIIFEINNSYIQRYIQELKNPNEEIRNNAIISLVKMRENAMPYLLSQLNDPNVVKVLEKMDDETIVKSFVHPDWKVRMRATRLPKHIGQGAIIRSLNSSNRKVRQNAAHVLIYNICNNDDEYLLKNAKEFTAIFIQALNDPNENVRCAVAKALRYLGPEAKEAIPTLIQSLKDNNTNVRIFSTETLGKIGNDTIYFQTKVALIVELMLNQLYNLVKEGFHGLFFNNYGFKTVQNHSIKCFNQL